MSNKLMLDGLDRLRGRLDELAMALPDWQFQMVAAPDPHPFSAVQVEGYCEELKKHAGIILYEEHITSGQWEVMIDRLQHSLEAAVHASNSRLDTSTRH